MDSLFPLLDFFSPEPIWELIGTSTEWMALFAPVFFLITMLLRVGEHGLRGLSGSIEWGAALRDVFWINVFFVSYLFIGYSIVQVVLSLGTMSYGFGSFETLAGVYKDVIGGIEHQAANSDSSALEKAADFLNSPVKWVAWGLFFMSFVFVIFTQIFLKLGYVLILAFNYQFGAIALLTSGSKIMSLEKGWTKTWIALALFPLIEALLFFMITVVVTDWSESVKGFASESGARENLGLATVYFLFFFVNMIVLAIEVVAFWAAHAASNNAGTLMAGMAPFMAAGAMAADKFNSATSAAIQPAKSAAIDPIAGAAAAGLHKANVMGGNVAGKGLAAAAGAVGGAFKSIPDLLGGSGGGVSGEVDSNLSGGNETRGTGPSGGMGADLGGQSTSGGGGNSSSGFDSSSQDGGDDRAGGHDDNSHGYEQNDQTESNQGGNNNAKSLTNEINNITEQGFDADPGED